MKTKRLNTNLSLSAIAGVAGFTSASSVDAGQTAPPPADKNKAKQEEERKLIAVLQSADAAPFEKDVACRRLAAIGTKEAVLALAALLTHDHLYDVARFGLEPIPDPAADEALRAALPKLKGRPLAGVIDSIGNRRDGKALGDLIKLLGHADAEVASAAAGSLGKIGSPEAAEALTRALDSAPAAVRPAVGDACVAVADTWMMQGKLGEAATLFDRVRGAKLPGPIRAAAMRGAILARQAKGAPLLVEQLKGEDWSMFYVALRVVRELPGTDAIQALAPEVAKLPSEKRNLLVQALGDRRDPVSLSIIVAQLTDPATKDAACPSAVSIGERIVRKHAAEVAEAMKKVLDATDNAEVTKRAKALLDRAGRTGK